MKTSNILRHRRKYTVLWGIIFSIDCGPVLFFRVSWIGDWNECYRLATNMASLEKNFRVVFRNSIIEERKKELAKVLQFPEFNEEDELRTATLIDVYYEMLSYLVNYGFPWREVASFFEMFRCLLNETQGKRYKATDRHIHRDKAPGTKPAFVGDQDVS